MVDPHPANAHITRRIWLFGALRLQADHQLVAIPTGKCQALFSYLALHPHTPHTRDQLADRLWPTAAPDRARRNLSDLLYRLRQGLNDDWLVVDNEQIGLRVGDDLWVDVWTFEQLVERADPLAWEQAATLYQGELLPELYDDWVLMRRVALEENYLACLLRLGGSALAADQLTAAHTHYLKLTQVDPLREEAYLGLMRCLTRLNRPTAALQIYDQLTDLLEQTLGAGVQPGQTLQELAGQLRHELRLRQDTPDPAQRLWLRPPFVGRQAERAALLARLAQARQGQGGLMTLLGPAGSGKTRLLEELASAADWRGWQVVWGSGEDLSLPQPYAPLGQALEQALPTPRRQQLRQLMAVDWLRLVETYLLPGIEAADLSAQIQQPLSDPPDLIAALSQLLTGLSQITPHLIVLDDSQWADPEIWTLLDGIRWRLAELPILLLLSARPEELRRQAAWATLEQWDQAGDSVLHLPRLSETDLYHLARAVGHSPLTAAQLTDLSRVSGGNPLLALALLKQGQWETAAPASLASMTVRQLTSVSNEAQSALQAAAVIGYQVDYELWQALLKDDESLAARLPQLAGELERAGLIELEPDHYRFIHDTLRTTVYQQIDLFRRRRYHAQLLLELTNRQPDDHLTLLYQAEQAEQPDLVGQYALAVGKQALAGFRFQGAVRYFSQALAELPETDQRRRYQAYYGRMRAFDGLTNRDAQRQDLTVLHQLAADLADQQRQIEVTYHQAAFDWSTGELHKAQATAETGLNLARASDDQKWQPALLGLLGRIAKDLGDYKEAEIWLAQARDHYQLLGDHFGEATMIDALGGLAWQRGDYARAISNHQRAADSFSQQQHLRREAAALNNLGSAYWGLGDYAQARATHHQALALSRQLGDRRIEGDNLDNIGGTYWALGDYEQAIDFYSQALEIRRATDDLWGIAISLNNLATAWRDHGQPAQAIPYYEEALAVNRQMGRRRGEGYVRHGQGLTHLEAGELELAHERLTEAAAIRRTLGERDNLLETMAILALTELQAGQIDSAKQKLQTVLETIGDETDRAALRQWVHYVAFQFFTVRPELENAKSHLRRAEAAMLEIAEPLSSTDREQFLKRLPLNRKIRAALAEFEQSITVQLVRETVPLGRRLVKADYQPVRWTIYALSDEAFDNPAERRRHILSRLLTEAKAQGAAPTDADLAAALNVSRRTILRDMNQLRTLDPTLTTRRRSD